MGNVLSSVFVVFLSKLVSETSPTFPLKLWSWAWSNGMRYHYHPCQMGENPKALCFCQTLILGDPFCKTNRFAQLPLLYLFLPSVLRLFIPSINLHLSVNTFWRLWTISVKCAWTMACSEVFVWATSALPRTSASGVRCKHPQSHGLSQLLCAIIATAFIGGAKGWVCLVLRKYKEATIWISYISNMLTNTAVGGF